MRKMAVAVTWICYSSHTNRMFCILGEVGAEVKVAVNGTLILTPK